MQTASGRKRVRDETEGVRERERSTRERERERERERGVKIKEERDWREGRLLPAEQLPRTAFSRSQF